VTRLALAVLVPLFALGRLPDYAPHGLPLPGKPGARLAQLTLAADSSHTYDIRHYRLDFDLPMTNSGYSCREQVCLRSEIPALDTFSLHFAGLVCDSIKRSGVPIAFATPSGLLTVDLDIPLPQGESTTLDIFFRRESTARQVGYFFARPPTTLHAHAMTCGCPRDNHYWFACWDWPWDKAERGCQLNLTVPDTFQACANGWLDSVTTAPGGKRTWWWRHPFPISTYLMTFSASRFARWDTVVTTPGGETVPLIHYMWPRDSATTRSVYRLLPQMMAYYADTCRFGPYPFERFGHVLGYYGFPWGGMEHQTQVMLHTGYLNGGGDATIAHELSHMWWGDMVTHVGYADVWLNEGFATWAECQCMGHLNGRPWFQTYIRGKASAYFVQARSRDFPIYNPAWNDIYNYGIIYCKGAWVMRMLQLVVGDTAWDSPGVLHQALRAYRDSFAYGTVSTADWQRQVERASGLDLDWFFTEWVYNKGYPRYALTWTAEPETGYRVVVTLTQNNGTGVPPVFHMPLPVRFWCSGVSRDVTLRPDSTVFTDTFYFAEAPDSVRIDPDNWVLDSNYVTAIAAPGRNPLLGPSIISVSPNPARGCVNLQLPIADCRSPGAKMLLRITDISGRVISTRSLDTRQSRSTIYLRLPAGVYFAQLVAADTGPFVRFVLTD